MSEPIKPKHKPQLDEATVREVASRILRNSDQHVDGFRVLADCPVMILGVRGYFRNTLGKKGVNDLGVFDDAAFLITPESVTGWNWNCDPSKAGFNKGVHKLYAQLNEGIWPFRQGPHRGVPGHFRQMTDEEAQRAKLENYFSDNRKLGEFIVKRITADGIGEDDEGMFNINIHPGGKYTTSSWGCQTCLPEQWVAFKSMAYEALEHHGQTWAADRWIPYILTDEKLA